MIKQLLIFVHLQVWQVHRLLVIEFLTHFTPSSHFWWKILDEILYNLFRRQCSNFKNLNEFEFSRSILFYKNSKFLIFFFYFFLEFLKTGDPWDILEVHEAYFKIAWGYFIKKWFLKFSAIVISLLELKDR